MANGISPSFIQLGKAANDISEIVLSGNLLIISFYGKDPIKIDLQSVRGQIINNIASKDDIDLGQAYAKGQLFLLDNKLYFSKKIAEGEYQLEEIPHVNEATGYIALPEEKVPNLIPVTNEKGGVDWIALEWAENASY